jgi:hypothetical protein
MPFNQEKIDRDLRENDSTSSEFQKEVVSFCMAYVKNSADEMARLYDNWDSNDAIYRGYRALDRDDKKSVKDGEPPKIIVPITYAQTQTALSFIFSTFAQKPAFFELVARGPEDVSKREALETDLDYQCQYQKMMLKLYLYLLDNFKYGFGVMKVDWTEKYCKMRVGKKEPVMDMMSMLAKMFGQPAEEKFQIVERIEDVLEYQGNRLANVSPYSFYPDPSVTIANFQDGKFVAHDEETSRQAVVNEEGQLYHGTGKIPETIASEDMRERKRRTGAAFKSEGGGAVAPGAGTGSNKPSVVVKTEVVFTMSEKDASRLFKFDLGENDYPVKWVAVIGNDKKLIQLKPTGYLHNMYNYALSEFSPDNNTFYNPGLSDTIYELQHIITFFLNSHIVNVKKIIQNRFIGDDSKVHREDIENNAAFIRLKQSGLPIDKIVQQLQVSDVTRQHVADMDVLMKLVQVVTGINENALGQYATGRRSATEARSVSAGSAARLKMHGQLFWLQGLEPLGRQMLSNTRQGRSKNVYDMIVGSLAAKAPFEQVILADPASLAGGYDFAMYDATLPSDKSFQANVLQELFTVLISNPNAMQLLNKSPIPLLEHIASLYGIKNMSDFNLTPEQALPPLESKVVPDAQVREQAAAGQVAPVSSSEDMLASLAQS